MLSHNKPSFRPAVCKSQNEVGCEWDQIARLRHEQKVTGTDLSFNYVLIPSIQALLTECNLDRVVDLGCGTGELAKKLSEISVEVTGIDASPLSVDIALETCRTNRNIAFHHSEINQFAEQWTGPRFTTAVANMTLMACLNLEEVVEAVGRLVDPEGYFVGTITHPWFWPFYWGYADADWFNYQETIVIEGPFRISAEVTNYITTHVHRPLSAYINSLSQVGYQIDRILEPYPSQEQEALYPTPWRFPRFLAFRARRGPFSGM